MHDGDVPGEEDRREGVMTRAASRGTLKTHRPRGEGETIVVSRVKSGEKLVRGGFYT